MKFPFSAIAQYAAGASLTLGQIAVLTLLERTPDAPRVPLVVLTVAPFLPLVVGFLFLATGRHRIGWGAIGMGFLSFFLPWHLILGS